MCEHWTFPLLAPAPKTDLSAFITISFQPPYGLKLFSPK
jgi:hypothetical protein